MELVRRARRASIGELIQNSRKYPNSMTIDQKRDLNIKLLKKEVLNLKKI